MASRRVKTKLTPEEQAEGRRKSSTVFLSAATKMGEVSKLLVDEYEREVCAEIVQQVSHFGQLLSSPPKKTGGDDW